MSINYSYKIISVDEQARCMEVIYTAEGREMQHIGARLPYEGETVEQIVRMYAPVAYWLEKERVIVAPEIGLSGAINAADEEAAAIAAIQDQQNQPATQGAQQL